MTNGTTKTTTSGAPRLGARTETSMVPLPRTGTPPTVTGIKLLKLLQRKPITAMAITVTVMAVTAAVMEVTVKATATTMADTLQSLKAMLPRVLIKRKTHLANGLHSNPGMTTMSGPNRPTALMPTPDGASLTTPSPLSLTMTSNTLARSGPTTTSGPRITTATTLRMPPATRRPHLRTTRPELRPPTTSNQSRLAIPADMEAMADMDMLVVSDTDTAVAAMVAITDTANGE